ncbi:CST complex subunit STN1-like isoform X2 [Anneissia japonica]|uniref:CST complex subunit STN1-like isoform X2 n=1 Tax=Anneissia japonica TaxID=1529436 RepID=UPI0014256C7B|nr:CST complex subunit STN1-like isoform X2 [Anneissia japonica]
MNVEGQNPISKAFAKLYIKDVLALEGIETLHYNGHPICKVDIYGIVVKVIEKQKFFLYGVDDGTGVINCCCWKPSQEPQPFSPKADVNSLSIKDFLRLKISDNLVEQMTPIEFGESIHVRGRVKTYRGDIQVSASFFEKVDDPRCEREIARMMELPKLYRDVYDQQFIVEKEEIAKKSEPLVPGSLIEAVEQFLRRSETNSFYIAELQTVDHLMDIIKGLCINTSHEPSTSAKPTSSGSSTSKKVSATSTHVMSSSKPTSATPAIDPSTSSSSSSHAMGSSTTKNSPTMANSAVDSSVSFGSSNLAVKELSNSKKSSTITSYTMFKEVVHHLEQRGLVYKSDSEKDLYYVTIQEKLSIAGEVLKTLNELYSKTKDMKGCHYLQILKQLKHSKKFSKVTENALLEVLHKLEENSDVISTTNKHYIPFPTT